MSSSPSPFSSSLHDLTAARFPLPPQKTFFALSPNKYHSARGWMEIRSIDAVSFFLFVDYRADISLHFAVRRALAQETAQVVIVLAEKARAQLSVCSQSNARAMPAEGLRHGCDQPDLSGSAIGEAVLARRLALLVRDLHQRPPRVNALVNFGGWHDVFAGPRAIRIQRHKFDEAHNHAARAREFGEGFHFVVIQPTHQHRIDLGGAQP